ncbi:hypothetical protein CPAV1605_1538 [seawater metagenome]|uniref:Uncharacterized protein n=1 Tax=seawater metagenome TaxID=1561972 RepID=A0A5E8CMD8_9ZZZZ
MIKYNLNVFANLSKISSIMKGGAMTPVMESTLESGPIEEVIAFLETQDLNNPSNYPLLISIFSLIFKRSIDFQIKMLDYFYTKSIPIYFEYLNMKCNTYSITIKNFLSGDPNTDFDQKLLLLKRIIEVMSLSPDNTSNSFFFIENLFWSITYMKRLAPDRRMAFLEILTSYIDLSKICQAINHFSSRPIFFSNASIKNYIPLIFMFVYQTNKELDTQFYINFFSKNLFKGLNKVLDKDVSKKLITDCFSFILKQEDSPNKRAFFGINNKGQTVFQNLFSKLVLSTEDAISYYTPLLIELIINSPTQTLLEQGQAGQTILHNMIFNNYPLSLIARTFEKAPLLIEICDDKKRYPIFYVAEFKSSIELFKFIKQQTPSKYYKILSTQQKFILEFLFKNFSTISYEATDIADFIQDNNHLTLINSIESFSYIEARGLYDPDLKCTNKTLQQIIAYKLYKDTRDGASSISIEKKRALLTAIGGVPIPQNNNVREIRINKAGNIIEQYLAVLKTAPNNLNSNTTYFKILGEHAIDAGGPQRTVWGLLQKEFLGDKYCETLNGKIYFRAVNSEAAFIALGNMIGRAYIYGPQVQKQTNERDAWGDLIIKNIYSSLGMLSPEMSKIILVGLFNTIIPERLEELIAADCAPNEDSLNSWLFDNINSLIQFGGPDGIPLQIEDSIENILRNIEVFHDYTVMYESELNVLQFFHELIFIDSTKSKIDPNFIAWVNLYNTELKALEVKKKGITIPRRKFNTTRENANIF